MIVLALSLIVSAFSVTSQGVGLGVPICPGENTVFSTCVNQCPPICPNQDGGRMCTLDIKPCQKGCQCIAGYLLDGDSCVLPEDCPPFECSRPNEIYSRCGEECTETCASLLGQAEPYCKSKPRECFPTCICKRGYVRSGQFRCVPARKCGICRRANEEYLDCGPVCQQSCQERSLNRDCPTYCVKGCFCKPGYVRDGNSCVKYTDCPQ